MDCREEHERSHQHDCAHHHDCDHGPADAGGEEQSLFHYIDSTRVRGMNCPPTSALRPFKPWAARNDSTQYLESECDPELLLFVPFTCAVKIKSICVIGGGDSQSPNKLRVFINRDDLDFGTVAAMTPTQDWDLQMQNANGALEYPTRMARFQNVSLLILHFPTNFGAPRTRIDYIGIKGEATTHRREIVHAIYELAPMPGKRGLFQTSSFEAHSSPST
eukprot:gnl/Spiro4/8103_TR4269_c0_g1_i1.p1 gnl/Spiro4/8103_TR4269_c0_g1~~gnl/Spiro4/8103_TR4269_c0_g1_i1.p1  ORF type:complete len:233 (-),score=65.43 gnl/Spiro4/8103_TR4269_c0_g1_i1:51-707(-)